VSTSVFFDLAPSASRASTVTRYVPAFLGVPDRVPRVWESLIPAGSFPLTSPHFTGFTPPAVRIAARYARPTVAGFRRVVVTASREATLRAELADVLRPSVSLAVSTNLNVPAALGVPAIVPLAGSSVSPVGSEPEDTDQVYDPLPPVTVAACPKRMPTSAVGRAAGANGEVTTRDCRTLIANVAVSECPPF
jgi:hypothetical protein